MDPIGGTEGWTMELRDVRTFVTVAGSRSFSRAAETLHAAQSTVSARIAALEAELGVRLFDRLGRTVALTEAGTRLLDFARKLVDLEEEARAWVAGDGNAGGRLTVRVPESLCVHRMQAVMKRFHEQSPGARLSLVTCALDGLEADLRQGVTDLAFVYMDDLVAGDLKVECLGEEPLVLAAAPSHALARRAKIQPGSFHGVPLLLSKGDCSYRRMFEGLLAEHQVETGPGMEFSSLAALKACLAQGWGVSILPAVAMQDEPRLRILKWTGPTLATGILMVWHREKWLSPLLASFMDLMREEIGWQLPQGT